MKNAIKYYFLYIVIVLLAIPVIVYLLSFLVGKFLLGNEVSFETIMNSSALDDVTTIIGNLLLIVVFIKNKYTNISFSKSQFKDKALFSWAFVLELSSVLPINILVALLDFNDYAMATAGDTLSVASVLGICLLAPLAEEMVMRGGVEEELLQWRNNPMVAILLSSFLFAILHFYPSMIVGAFLGGIIYGWIYYRTRNIWICFLMHFANNSLSCLLDWSYSNNSINPDILFQTNIIILALFSLVLMAVSIVNINRKTNI